MTLHYLDRVQPKIQAVHLTGDAMEIRRIAELDSLQGERGK